MTELEKLRLKLAQLEEQLALARGDSCRANYRLEKLVELRSCCLKAIAQLTLCANNQALRPDDEK